MLSCLAFLSAPVAAQEVDPAVVRARVERAVADAKFAGVYAVSRGGVRVAGGAAGEAAPGRPFQYESVFPWASVTKQAVAVMVMQEVARGRVALDAPASRYLPGLRGGVRSPTVRELLQHRAGLRNPEDSAKDADGNPSFYSGGPTGASWCEAGRARPGGVWRYNNCDYILLGAMLERVNRRPLPDLFAERVAGPIGARVRFVRAEVGLDADTVWAGGPGIGYLRSLRTFGSAGALVGTAEDMLAFDGGLMSGALLPDRARAEIWRGDPRLGFQALGQWSFPAPLKGCAGPVRLIERRGAIGNFQVRNFIAPDQGMAMVLLTNRGDYDFGEIWQGGGASHDLLAAALCP